MKKVAFNGKLSLNKQTVTQLNDEQMKHLKGGVEIIDIGTEAGIAPSHRSGCKRKPCLTATLN